MSWMRRCEVAVVGGGPAGLSAAAEAASFGAEVVLLDRNEQIGGQLIKQTHRFFGSRKQRAGTRGINIVGILVDEVKGRGNIELLRGADVMGYYRDGVLAYEYDETWQKIKPSRVIFCTGAAERVLAFENGDLPGVYGAGAVQTLMNVHGVRPADRVLMVGAGNIGLIVSYQLLQAGVEVVGIVEAAPTIGGYLVHASKVRRLGVPILTGHTVSRARGEEYVTGATLMALDEQWNPVPGSEMEIDCDAICLAVGLNPLVDMLWQAGCEMSWVSQLGGYVPWRDEHHQTSREGVYVAGDAAGVEEASSAMMEGRVAGLACAHSLGYADEEEFSKRGEELDAELEALRGGPMGEAIREGLKRLKTAPVKRQVLVEGAEE